MGQVNAGHKVAGRIDWLGIWAAEGRRAILWLPVFMGGGIWLYFALEREPEPLWCVVSVVPLAAFLSGLARRAGLAGLALALALTAFGAGFSLAVLAAHRAAAPMLSAPVEKTVEGRVRWISRAASGAPRVLLDRVVIYGLDSRETPAQVRVTLLAAERENAPRPRAGIRVFARLLPPGEPVEPGAFDFRLRAFFEGIGAVGYARAAALSVETSGPSGPFDRLALWLARQRVRIADALVTALPGARGAFAAAIAVGDRSHIDAADAEALRASNLAHLLAISGLHMGLLTGLVFAFARLLLVALPRNMSGASARKIAAVTALVA